ncbi:MAG: MerR family transcriptional regulator [Chloroflexi bacterium]|nr:MerR family transcriptional regulator [Chloroflexota bacterium]
MTSRESEPCYVIRIAAQMVGVHAQTLRYYERAGIVEPSRSRGNQRLYSDRDIARLRQIKTLVDDLGINLAGVEVILRLTEKIATMEDEIEELRMEIARLKG